MSFIEEQRKQILEENNTAQTDFLDFLENIFNGPHSQFDSRLGTDHPRFKKPHFNAKHLGILIDSENS